MAMSGPYCSSKRSIRYCPRLPHLSHTRRTIFCFQVRTLGPVSGRSADYALRPRREAVRVGARGRLSAQGSEERARPVRRTVPGLVEGCLNALRAAIVVHGLSIPRELIRSDRVPPWYQRQKTNDIGSDRDPKSVSAHKGDFYENPNEREPQYNEREHSWRIHCASPLRCYERSMLRRRKAHIQMLRADQCNQQIRLLTNVNLSSRGQLVFQTDRNTF